MIHVIKSLCQITGNSSNISLLNLLSHLGSGHQMSSVVVAPMMWEPTGFKLAILGLLGLYLIH
jgi:hypothetical protein